MKISLNWIKDYIDLPKEKDLSQIAHDLTMSTVEVEGITRLKDRFDKIIVGVIQNILPHPKADKLQICKTDIGGGVIKDIVCGGINVAKGMKVAVSLPGAFVFWHGESELTQIELVSLKGVESYGMICASAELGLEELYPNDNQEEILDLNFLKGALAGDSLANALEIDDVILEIDNKSLTNRPDLWGHYGMARELSALYNLPLKKIQKNMSTEGIKELKVEVQDKKACTRYIGTKIEGVQNIPSPTKIKNRLWSVGVRPIGTIVDITNYVMLALGQPTHAFDASTIANNIIVRRAQEGEKLAILGGKKLSLKASDLVIAHKEGAIGLAGVVGGAEHSVSKDTKDIILEIANFNPGDIRRSCVYHDLRTESSIRNEKGIDQNRCDLALFLTLDMLKESFPDMKIIEYSDYQFRVSQDIVIEFSFDWLLKRLGKDLPYLDIEQKLENLGFKVSKKEDNVSVIVPSWRATGDVSIAEDILEEVARIYGFEYFEPKPITTTFEGAINQVQINLDRNIREYLAFRCDMREIFTYPWVNEDYLMEIMGSTEGTLSLSSPPSPKEKFLRPSLLPNLCKVVSENLRYFEDFSIFELAQVFLDKDYTSAYDKTESLPHQHKSVAGAFVAEQTEYGKLLDRAKRTIADLSKFVHIKEVVFEQAKKPFWADNYIWLNIITKGKVIGSLGLLSKKAAFKCGIKNSAVVMFELNIDELEVLPSRTNKFEAWSEHPLSYRDLSLLVDINIKWKNIVEAINTNIKSDFIQDISFVDEYKGEQVPEGKKSITLNLIVGSKQKTLTSKEIEESVNSVVNLLQKQFNAKLR